MAQNNISLRCSKSTIYAGFVSEQFSLKTFRNSRSYSGFFAARFIKHLALDVYPQRNRETATSTSADLKTETLIKDVTLNVTHGTQYVT